MTTKIIDTQTGKRRTIQLPTVAAMVAAKYIVVGDVVETADYFTGTGGGNRYEIVAAGTGTADGGSFIDVTGPSTAVQAKALWFDEVRSIRQFGATGAGIADDRAVCQLAVDSGASVFAPDGTYLIGDSGTTIPYRATTTKAGIVMPSNCTIEGNGFNTIFKVLDSSDAVPFTANGKTKLTLRNLRIQGNSANQSSGLAFGHYFLNCSDFSLENVWIYDTESNTHEFIGCSNFRCGHLHAETASPAIGGGPQFEDCSDGTVESVTGNTFDDLVSVIAHGANVSDMTFVSIEGQADAGRALFIGQSSSAISQRNISDISANVNSHDCATNAAGLSAAVVVNRGANFSNLNINLVDQDSYQSLRIVPSDGTFNGSLKGCIFDIQSIGAKDKSIDMRHNDNVGTIVENNSLKAIIINPNVLDATAQEAIELQGGKYWDLDLNVTYPSGKSNPASAVRLGLSGSNAKVVDSVVKAIINGGDLNLTLVNTDNVNLDSLVLVNSENSSNINLDILANATNTRIGTVIRDGEIQDGGVTTSRDVAAFASDGVSVGTAAATSETDLMSYTVPADFMGKTGVIHLRASGTITGTNDIKTLKVHFGGSSITLAAHASGVTGDWSLDVYIKEHTNRATQRLDVVYSQDNAVVLVDSASFSVTTTSAVTLKVTGQTANASDEVTQDMMVVEGF